MWAPWAIAVSINNVIYDVEQDGILYDNRPVSIPKMFIAFLNNTIRNIGRDGICLYNESNANTLVNNAIAQVRDRFIVFQRLCLTPIKSLPDEGDAAASDKLVAFVVLV